MTTKGSKIYCENDINHDIILLYKKRGRIGLYTQHLYRLVGYYCIQCDSVKIIRKFLDKALNCKFGKTNISQLLIKGDRRT